MNKRTIGLLFFAAVSHFAFSDNSLYSPEQRLLGKWVLPEESISFEFEEDGTVIYAEQDFEEKARYQILGGNMISITMEDRTALQLKFHFKDKYLIIEDKEGSEEKFQKVEPAEQGNS